MGQKLCCTIDPEIYNPKSIEIADISLKDSENFEEPLTHDESKKGQSPFEMASNEHKEVAFNEPDPLYELMENLGRRISICSRKFTSISHEPFENSYQEKGMIGKGGFCEVWKVIHKLTGDERAMKSILKGISCNDREPDINEVNILKELDHPNIIKIYEIYVSQKKYHIIMEFVTGGDLHDFITKKNKQYTEKDVSKWMHDILTGVSYCHSKNVIHMDIKPENIVFQDDASDTILKIIDFGISILKSAASKSRMGNGKVYYKAPEVFDNVFSAKADVWSCGVLLYWLLSRGRFPFKAKNDRNEQATINIIRNEELIFPNEEWNWVSDDAKDLIKKMLTKDPDQRISAREALDHPWIQGVSDNLLIDHNLMRDAFSRLAKFNSYLTIRHAALEYISTHFSISKDIRKLQKAFKASDKDNNGVLSKYELSEVISNLKLRKKTDIEELIQKLDADQNGMIDYSEFLTGAIDWEKNMSTSKLEATFKAFDLNSNGEIDIDELKQVLGDNEMVDEDTWSRILSEADFNNDGKIQPFEFETVLTRTYLDQGLIRTNIIIPRPTEIINP